MSSSNQKLRAAGALAVLSILAFAISCRGFFPPEQLASITISPTSPNVPLGGTTQLTAFGTNTDSSSAGNISGKVSWTSSSGAIGVNGSGVLSGNDLSSTPATITAEYQGISATASANVCVENGTNFMITLTPSSVVQGNTSMAEATTDVSGISGPVDISSGVQWSTSNTGVTVTAGDPATIDTSGLSITAQTIVTIFATYTCNGLNNNFQTNLTVTVE
jgi:Big-like domain-containing protein